MTMKLVFIVLAHIAFLIAYPHTGPMGGYYLLISALIWCGFCMFLSANVLFASMAGAIFGQLVTIVFFAALFLTLASTMPQSDNLSILGKLDKGIYPDRNSLYDGLLRVGIQYDGLLKKSSNDFDAGVKQTIKAMKR
ncbi:MAG: hypothetical protein NTX59_09065 [Elusimicrobia bacterium]|nr:hypothetical protein [Elusimicrobiota bacterium]